MCIYAPGCLHCTGNKNMSYRLLLLLLAILSFPTSDASNIKMKPGELKYLASLFRLISFFQETVAEAHADPCLSQHYFTMVVDQRIRQFKELVMDYSEKGYTEKNVLEDQLASIKKMQKGLHRYLDNFYKEGNHTRTCRQDFCKVPPKEDTFSGVCKTGNAIR